MKRPAVIKYTDDSTDTSADAQRLSYMKIVVEAVITAMRNADERTLCCAARSLGKLKAKDAVKHLVGYLKYPDPDVICDAASALGKIDERESTPHLIQLLKDEDGLVRMCAIQALSDIGDSLAVEPLIQSMNSTAGFPVVLGELSGDYQWEIRERAAKALGKIKDQRVVQGLIDMLKNEDADMMLGTIFKSLMQQGDRKGIEAVALYLKDPDAAIRRKASSAFIYAEDVAAIDYIKDALVDEDISVKCNAIEAIGNIGNEKDALLLVLLLKDSDIDVRKIAAEVMVKIIGEKAVKYILPLLSDKDRGIRKKAVELLTIIGSAACVDPLINILKDPDHEVCEEAIASIAGLSLQVSSRGRLKDLRVINQLIAILQDKEKAKTLRSKAIMALTDTCPRMPAPASSKQGHQAGIGAAGVADVVHAIFGILKDDGEDKELRQLAFLSLKTFDEQAVTTDITTLLLENNSEFIKKNIARILRNFNSPESEEILLSLLNDGSDIVKSEAAISLAYRGNDTGLALLSSAIKDENCGSVAEICDAVKNIKNEVAMNLLLDSLTSKNAILRCYAVMALGQTCSKDAVTHVIRMLNDDNKGVRREAIVSLGMLGDRRALEPLALSLFNHEMFNGLHHEINAAIRSIDKDRAAEILINILQDKEKRDNHWVSIEALSEIYF